MSGTVSRRELITGVLITVLGAVGMTGYLVGREIISARPAEVASIKPNFVPFEGATREITFTGSDGVTLTGEINTPLGPGPFPLVVFIHHSGPETRDIYQHLAARLAPLGYASFRFDKRGTGFSSGVYGCCEAEDALAAYRAAVVQPEGDEQRVFVIAQSLGSKILADYFDEFAAARQPHGIILLSSLLAGEAVGPVAAPIHIIVSDSEPNLAELTEAAVSAHRSRYSFGATYFIAPHTEHTLFDIATGPVDWQQPDWPDKFSREAWLSLVAQLEAWR